MPKLSMKAILDHSIKDILAGLTGVFLGNRLFDLRHKTDTFGKTRAGKSGKHNLAGSVGYQPVIEKNFTRMFRLLGPSPEGIFLDIGSGKGKALLLALEYGFKKIIGVEYRADLCEIARKNVEHFKKRYNLAGKVEIIQKDITQYSFSGEKIIYMFNALGQEAFTSMVNNLSESLKTHPRQVTFVYTYPIYERIMRAHPLFRLKQEARFAGIRVVAYESFPPI